MKYRYQIGLFGFAAALSLAFLPAVRGEEGSRPAAPEMAASKPSEPAAQPADTQATAPAAPPVTSEAPAAEAAPASSASETAAAPAAAAPLRRIDSGAATTAKNRSDRINQKIEKAKQRSARRQNGRERVNIGSDTYIGKDETMDSAVAVAGRTTVDGKVTQDAVSVVGGTTVNGSVNGDAVTVVGNTVVNGSVGGDVVAVAGNVVLGPKAVIGGDVVAVAGAVQRAPGAEIHGDVRQVGFIRFPGLDWLFTWVKEALFKGRLLAFSAGTGWAWSLFAGSVIFFALLALVFRPGVERCVDVLETRPGFTILTAVLTFLAIPLALVLLSITVVGVVLLVVALVACALFGRAVLLAWMGKLITKPFGAQGWAIPAVNVLIGGVVVMLLFTVPIVAFVVAMLLGVMSLGVTVYPFILSMRRNGAKSGPAAPAVSAAAPVAAAVVIADAGTPSAEAGAAAPTTGIPIVVPPAAAIPPLSAASLPRAGFWIRFAALMIDLILCRIVIIVIPGLHFSVSLVLFMLAVYGAVMWKLRGTTVGGAICHLKVVRLDDRPLDWTASIVRVLGCFLSLAIVGLGFIWASVDPSRQSWHDKIAGTTVVRTPSGISLI